MNTVGVARSFVRHRRLARWLGWLGLAVAAPVLCACTARSLSKPVVVPEDVIHSDGPVILNRNVDMLFLVDDSSSMRSSQEKLRRNFPALMTALREMPGGLPNVHIAVVSSDMGVSSGDWDGCDAHGGKNGIFQYAGNPTAGSTASPPCATGLDPGATFISDIGGVRNYSGSLEDSFACIAALGENGCGFEHQFAAITRALGADGSPAPSENAGFLRKDAYLVVIMITNEDDCSATPNVPLFDSNSNTNIGSVLGPNDFRCNEFGHICTDPNGKVGRPKRSPPGQDVTQRVSYTDCRSDDDDAYLLRTTDVASALRRLKADPGQVLVAAITGPSSPYTVFWKPPTIADTSCGAASCPWPDMEHSCTAADGGFADPSVRVSQFVDQFGADGLRLSICDADFTPALDRIGRKIVDRLSKPCVVGRIAKKPGTARDDCTVVSTLARSDDATGTDQLSESAVPACADTGGVGPCWQLVAGQDGCAGQAVDVKPDPTMPAPLWQNATVQCSLCAQGAPDPARGCP